ncbi:MAG: hypothetical protein II786_05025, partial [Muribaculaceae bacterium]|nr:hypothetical protein [Muribaculaceae bacterium]
KNKQTTHFCQEKRKKYPAEEEKLQKSVILSMISHDRKDTHNIPAKKKQGLRIPECYDSA